MKDNLIFKETIELKNKVYYEMC